MLIKKLTPVLTALKRAYRLEEKKLEDTKIIAAGFQSVDDAREAYGYESITLEQFELAREILEEPASNKNRALQACQWLSENIDTLRGDISVLRERNWKEYIEARNENDKVV